MQTDTLAPHEPTLLLLVCMHAVQSCGRLLPACTHACAWYDILLGTFPWSVRCPMGAGKRMSKLEVS